MPPAAVLIPLIIGGVSAAIGGTELGLELTKGGPPKPSLTPTTADVSQNRNQLASVVRQNLGNLQESGGGGLSPSYDANVIGSSTGTLNQSSELQDIIKQYLSGSGGTPGGAAPGATGGSAPTPVFGTIGGTSSNPNSPPTGPSGLVDSNIFGGL